MSTFAPGTGGTVTATNLPGAVVELARILDAHEVARNSANPSLAPQNRITSTLEVSQKNVVVTAVLPCTSSVDNTTGKIVLDVQNYLGTYGTITPAGDLKSTDSASALAEIAGKLALAELAIAPADRPNNIQVVPDQEAETLTITATIPVTITSSPNGFTATVVDYL